MCGRYNLIPDASAWADIGEILSDEILALLRALPPRHNVSPTQLVPIIVAGDDGKPTLIEARWGFIPHYWMQSDPPQKTTNVRSETAAKKPMWKHAWRNSRCLIPASGWYEWFILEDGSKKPPKVPHHIRRKDGKHIVFAGLWSLYHSTPDAPGLPTCSIVTIPSPPDIAEIHARTPVVLEPGFWRSWIDPNVTDAAQVSDMIVNGAVKLFAKDTLSNAVGNSRNQGADLANHVDRPEMDQQHGLKVDEQVLEWLRTTPADELIRAIAIRLDQKPTIGERRLWIREIEDRDDAEKLSELMDEIKASLKVAKVTAPKPPPEPPRQGGLF